MHTYTNREKQRAKQSNLGKGCATLYRENKWQRWRGCIMQHWVNDLLYKILGTKWKRGAKWKQETERKEWEFKAKCKSSAVIASPSLYGRHVFKGQLITTCHHTAWKNSGGIFFFPSSSDSLIADSWQAVPAWRWTICCASGLQTGPIESGRQWQPL